MRHKRKGHALARRYGRAWGPTSAITQPAAGGGFNVIVVDSRGTPIGAPLARGVSLRTAREIILKR
jgi:hypothetical protein